MQGYVSYNFSRKSKKMPKIIKLLAVVGIIVSTASILAFCFLGSSSKKIYCTQSYYYVCASNSQNSANLSEAASTLKALGGAGSIIELRERFYLVAGVYLSFDDASEVLLNVQKTYTSAEIVSISKTLSRSEERRLLSSEFAVKSFEFFGKFTEELSNSTMKFFAGTLSEHKFLNNLLASRVKLENLIMSASDDAAAQMICESLAALKQHIDLFFDKFDASTQKFALASELLVLATLSHGELFDNLQNSVKII